MERSENSQCVVVFLYIESYFIPVASAFTRTLTTLYSLTLLSLFTHIQLNLLGRSKYIQSVLDQEREEMLRDFSVQSLLWGQGVEDDLLQDVDPIDEEMERKFLTLSWWICHIGWKDVGERVRRGVEEVFEG